MISFNRIILTVAAVMFALGALDYLLGNRWGFGKKFTEGFQTFTPLFLTMAGFIILSPVLARAIAPVVSPLFECIGADPGLFPGIILACDNGAYPLAQSLCRDPQGAKFGGLLLGSVLGANVISIPIALQLLSPSDREFYFQGLIFGIITIPFGLLAGGLAAGFRLVFILRQLPPLIVLSLLLTAVLLRYPRVLIRILAVFAKTMEVLSIAGLTAAIVTELSGFRLSCLVPLEEAVKIVGAIVLILPGTYIFIEIVTRLFRKILPAAADTLKINESAVIGFLTTAANAIPTLALMKNMDARGKLLNCAFLSSGAYVLGDHLAFCGTVAPEMLFPLVVTKFTAGIAAVIAALMYLQKTARPEQRVRDRSKDCSQGL